MKIYLYILSFFLTINISAFAQDNAAEGNGNKIREKMTEYVQKRLSLSKSEAERFNPVFMNYFNELRNTNIQHRDDKLVLQQKIIDVRLRYRDQFKPIVGEKRSNDVFTYERDFVEEVKRLRQDRIQDRNIVPNQRKKGLLP
ncbi:MAG: hypothetical protein M3413_06365 [Bacteroidota bacterium]|jgi:hypothetical protein|nr:hypothetical protein [Flavisolibacter sp.]MDQ3551132.1 hypothetical protein [Bacteroidota bacterium]